MSMSNHLATDDLSRLRYGALTPAELLAVTAHLAECTACRDLGPTQIEARSLTALDGLLHDSAADHPNLETDLVRYVDGALPFDEHERVEAHLGVCDRCDAEVADLRAAAASLQASARRRSSSRYLLPAAALLAAATIAGVLLLRPTGTHESPPIRRPPVARIDPAPVGAEPPLKPEWEALVTGALRAGRVAMPGVLAEIRTPPETVRGEGKARRDAVSPAGVVTATDRPTFSWPAREGAESEVIVYNEDDELAASGPLRTNHWMPTKSLPRGVALVWQVEVRRGGASTIIPAPPDPPAIFRIIDDASLQEIEAARRTQPANELLIGLLYARAGVKDRAVEALRRHAAKHPETEAVLRSVESW